VEKAKLLNQDIETTNSEIKTLEKALGDYHQGKIPAQPKPAEAPANAPGQGKPAAKNSARVVAEQPAEC